MAPLPGIRSLLAVCAHPDDESFGLGAVITAFVRAGSRVRLLCLTHGEASTLSARPGLAELRAHELREASALLGVRDVVLHDLPDGRLADLPLRDLAGRVHASAIEASAEAVLTFDLGGITGHPDHQRATEAAIDAAVALAIPVLAWAIPAQVADSLNREYSASFVGRAREDLDIALAVDRAPQLAATSCHASQLTGNPVPHRRLALQGDREYLRYLHRP